MKRLKIAVMALFALVTVSNVNAQDENNPWAVGFGVNIVDFYVPGSDFGDNVKDHLGNSDWNFLPSISRISGEKYLEKGFSLQLAGSLSQIENVRTLDDSDFIYYAIDAIVKYDLNMLVGDTGWFDPFVYLGGGYVSADSEGEGMLNTGVGFNTWFNDNLGLTFQTGSKFGFADKVQDHIQTSLGLVVKFGGKDTDGDGIYDKNDACPEVAGLAEFNGCPDADGDGVKDSDDACPNTPGLAAMNGCPDSDGDGIADKDDMCPNSKGTKANKGCPDTDGDGVLDKDDKCVNVVGPASNNGCPEPAITKEAADVIEFTAKSILFNSGRASFKAGVEDQLDAIAEVMNKYPKATFAIGGHTDNTGSAALNLRLSNKRAIAVRDYLVEKGVDATRLEAKGFGEGFPIEDNNTRAGRANNRRVEIKVTN